MNKKNYWLLILSVAAIILPGCSSRPEEEPVSSESTEFFKEIDNMAIQENTELQEEQVLNAEADNEIVVVAPPEAPPVPEIPPPEKPTLHDIQQALKNAKLYEGKIDGVLGPKTKKSIEVFQAQNKLKVDGKVGPMTWEKLKTFYRTAPAPAAPVHVQPAEAVTVEPQAKDVHPTQDATISD